MSILKEQDGLNNSWFGNDEAELRIVSRIKIIRESGESSGAKKARHEFQMLQKLERNILWFGECSWL